MVLTACASTVKHSAINPPVHTVKAATIPPVPSALLTPPMRPQPPESGDSEALLNHVVEFGVYVQELEAQLKSWRDWALGDTP